MNQDFTKKKNNICLKKKNSCRGFHRKKRFCTSSEQKTFLMVRPWLSSDGAVLEQ